MITFKHKGDFSKTEKYFKSVSKVQKAFEHGVFDKYAKLGLELLREATPKDSGETANAWSAEIEHQNGRVNIVFNNSNINKGVSIALILQYGHGTGTGGYVQGRDYINPAIQTVFEGLADAAWGEVVKL